MLTKNNWFDCNLNERLLNSNSDFQINITPYDFIKMSFEESVNYTAKQIQDNFKKLYVSFSGGLDSEFVVRKFVELGIKFTPIIVVCGNREETNKAYEVCEELQINPVTILIEEEYLLDFFETNIHKKYNGIGINTTHTFFAAEYAKNRDGVIITGIHLNNDGSGGINSFASASEYDFYVDVEYGNVIHFFIYTMEIVYSMLQHSSEYESWDDFKNEIYNINFREKMKPTYKKEFNHKLKYMVDNREYNPKRYCFWNKKEIMEMLKC